MPKRPSICRDATRARLVEAVRITLIATAGLVFARMGLALARRIERRPSLDPGLNPAAEDRLRVLEEESLLARQELAELHERQDFTERLLQSRAAPPRFAPSG
ncbi:MAG: hypothetical protein H0T68_05225 [Gemmatimonadales bacterium]|nr:hypothetical protein [Gemmatimonadales bacterium]